VTAIVRLSGPDVLARAEELADLLADTVHHGASIGFLSPLDRAEALVWWKARAAAVETGGLAVWTACAGDRVTGTVSLSFPDKPNSRHRAELVKLMVHREARGQGLGRRLLTAAERAAADAGVTLLHLDTETGSPASPCTARRAGHGSGPYRTTRPHRRGPCTRRRSSTSG